MPVRVYNTLTRQKEPLQTVRPGKVGMYVCGPTVYKPSHVGHMVGPVIFDTVKRYLTYLGYRVTFVVNITDVDDKLIVRAKELNTTVKELAGDLAINPNTVVKAYRQLEHEGLAGGRPGQGTFITATLASPPPDASEPLRASLEQWFRDAEEAGLSEDAVTALIAVVRYDMRKERIG